MVKSIKRNFIAEQLKGLEEENFKLQLKSASREERFNLLYYREQKVKPKKYIWHLSSKKNRESILNNGIKLPKNNYAVFANNIVLNEFTIHLFWPIPIDSYEFNYYMTDVKGIFNHYDFWKIDTSKFKQIWRIDPFLRGDLSAYDLRSPYDYVCTKKDIPAHALELGTIKDLRLLIN